MYIDSEDLWAILKLIQYAGLCIFVVFGIDSCVNSDWYQSSKRAEDAQEAADAKPHVIREAEGCKVYEFKSGGYWHYFTRCSDGTVTTERSYDERHGKTTEHKTETIVTQGNK